MVCSIFAIMIPKIAHTQKGLWQFLRQDTFSWIVNYKRKNTTCGI